jgi:hypothetical protein
MQNDLIVQAGRKARIEIGQQILIGRQHPLSNYYGEVVSITGFGVTAKVGVVDCVHVGREKFEFRRVVLTWDQFSVEQQ